MTLSRNDPIIPGRFFYPDSMIRPVPVLRKVTLSIQMPVL